MERRRSGGHGLGGSGRGGGGRSRALIIDQGRGRRHDLCSLVRVWVADAAAQVVERRDGIDTWKREPRLSNTSRPVALTGGGRPFGHPAHVFGRRRPGQALRSARCRGLAEQRAARRCSTWNIQVLWPCHGRHTEAASIRSPRRSTPPDGRQRFSRDSLSARLCSTWNRSRRAHPMFPRACVPRGPVFHVEQGQPADAVTGHTHSPPVRRRSTWNIAPGLGPAPRGTSLRPGPRSTWNIRPAQNKGRLAGTPTRRG